MCPTSNVRTAVVPTFEAHPFRRFYDMGIPVTVNSDDPLPFFTDIEREYRLLVDEFGLSRDDLHRITMNAVDVAFLPAPERAALRALVESAFSAEPTR
jgi:adenosine deaminase